MKKVGKTTRPFRYDLNQIPYDYTVEVRNRYKGLDLIDRVPEELWMEVHDIVQETGIKTTPKKKKCKKKKSKGVMKPKSSYTGGNIIKWYSYFEEVKTHTIIPSNSTSREMETHLHEQN